MDGKQLHSLVLKITSKLQPLCSLLAEAFASYHNNDLTATPSQFFAKRMKDTYNGQKKKIYSLATNKLFDNNNPNKDNLKKDIEFNTLDIQVLLKLLIETDFLFERNKGTCGVHHSAKCCDSCKHQGNYRCSSCKCDKADCGKLCCTVCGKCVKCSRDKFEIFKDFYLSGKNCDIITMETSSLCYMANLKASLQIMLKWRNLVHVTTKECEHFVCNRSKSLGNDFKEINGGQDELSKIIHIAIKTVIKLLSDPNYFDGKVDFRKQVKEIENEFDEIIDTDSKLIPIEESSSKMSRNMGEFINHFINEAKHESEVMNHADFYQMTSEPRGFCIIINNYFLSTVKTRDRILLSQRNGTDVDGKAIEKLFGWLKFKVETKENVGRSQMLKILRDYALDDRNVNHDCLVICILSHGYEKGIYCNDGQEMDFAEMREYFNGKNCPNLNGKPKLFYIQACQGSGRAEESHITDGPPSLSLKSDPVSPGPQEDATVSASDKEPSPPPSSLAHEADFNFFVSATPGTVSYRNPTKGTWFIQELCNVFTENAKTNSLSMLRQKVNSKIAERFQKDEQGVAKMMSDGGLDTLRKEIRFGPNKSYQKYLEEDVI